jgi:hypothetical protein
VSSAVFRVLLSNLTLTFIEEVTGSELKIKNDAPDRDQIYLLGPNEYVPPEDEDRI